jgi:hypothetical protein
MELLFKGRFLLFNRSGNDTHNDTFECLITPNSIYVFSGFELPNTPLAFLNYLRFIIWLRNFYDKYFAFIHFWLANNIVNLSVGGTGKSPMVELSRIFEKAV